MEVGRWVQVSFGIFFVENHPKIALCLHALLKVVGYYDLSVLWMSVMGFPKKSLDGGWVG